MPTASPAGSPPPSPTVWRSRRFVTAPIMPMSSEQQPTKGQKPALITSGRPGRGGGEHHDQDPGVSGSRQPPGATLSSAWCCSVQRHETPWGQSSRVAAGSVPSLSSCRRSRRRGLPWRCAGWRAAGPPGSRHARCGLSRCGAGVRQPRPTLPAGIRPSPRRCPPHPTLRTPPPLGRRERPGPPLAWPRHDGAEPSYTFQVGGRTAPGGRSGWPW
jgi:hypothetical protein